MADGWRQLALVTIHFNRSGFQPESPFKVVVFLKLYLGHGLGPPVSQGRMSVSLGLREPDRLLLEKYCNIVAHKSPGRGRG